MEITDKDFTALILAGGRGRRFGGDKKNIVIGGERLIDRQIDILRGEFCAVIVSSNTPFERDGISVVKDERGEGPLAGIYAALKLCKTDYLYVNACDMPFISLEYIRTLKSIATRSGCGAVVFEREDGFLEPFNAIYKRSLLPLIEEQLERGEYKMSLFLNKIDFLEKAAPPSAMAGAMFFNINYKEDLDNWRLQTTAG